MVLIWGFANLVRRCRAPPSERRPASRIQQRPCRTGQKQNG